MNDFGECDQTRHHVNPFLNVIYCSLFVFIKEILEASIS